MEKSKAEDRSAYAQAIERRVGAMRGALGMEPESGAEPELEEQAARHRFHAALTTMLPRLRIYAMSLTRDSDRANDLVQQTVLNSLTGRKSFQPGTNFSGWLFRIERNEFISGLRRQRLAVELDDAIENTLSEVPRQESAIVLREFAKAFWVLPGTQRKVLLLAAMEGHSYKTIAARSDVSEGTVKSRVSRARARLREMLDLEVGDFTLAGPARPVGHAAPVA
jgi:RNA polymerase sigma-70 factor, ECF subfamily